MAEAHNAVAFQFAVTDEGMVVNLDKEILKLMANSAFKSVKRRCNSATNTFLKGVYPASPATWMFFLAALLSARYSNHGATMNILDKMEKEFPAKHRFERSTVVAICIFVSVTLVWLFSAYFCQFLLRILLRNWNVMYNSRGKLTLRNKLWLAAVKLLSGFNPGLFSFQNCLPSLPVPSLEDTLKRHLYSVKPFMNGEDYSNVEKLTKEFQNGVGPKLQRYLVLKSLWAPNYVSDWWERFVYLRSRAPLIINSNYYGVGALHEPPTTIQSARAANYIYALFRYRKQINKHIMKPLRLLLTYPLCSTQYTRQFDTTRIPGKEEDQLITFPEANYIVVYHRGRFFKLTVMFSGDLLKPADIQVKIKKILENTYTPSYEEEVLPVLTSMDRPQWAEIRSKYFQSGVNKESLDIVEKAAFVLVLDADSDFYSYEQSSQTDLNNNCKRMLHGKGYDRWFDKSFTLVICSNGKVGFNAEHSWADAPIMAQIWEWVLVEDLEKLGYNADGNCRGTARFTWNCPKRLEWEIPELLSPTLRTGVQKAQERIDDVELYTMIHTKFGKGDIKKMKVSPDAFIQVAFQLAYFKSTGKVCLTYESAMTRLFRDGRTETVRSCSIPSTEFAKAAVDPNISNEEKKALLQRACDYHINSCRDAMTGKGSVLRNPRSEFKTSLHYTGKVKGVILDWAGTVQDCGVYAPAVAFLEVFKNEGVPITTEEAREPMGTYKKIHIRKITEMESVRRRWHEKWGRYPNTEDVERMFENFVPIQLSCLEQYSSMIDGAVETVKYLQNQMQLKVGSSTGFTSEMLDIIKKEADKSGYKPDAYSSADEVPQARPFPYMVWLNCIRLDLNPIQAVVKVDDTADGIWEGLLAGSWTVGIARTGNYVGLNQEEIAALSTEDYERRLNKSYDVLTRAGAHYVIDTINDLPVIIDDINRRLATGEKP